MKVKQTLLTLASVIALSGVAVGGVVAEEPVASPSPIENISGDISVGYDSTYLFRGSSFGEDAAWSAIGLHTPLDNGVYVNARAFYVNATDGDFDFDKLNLFTDIGVQLGQFDAELGYIAHLFPGGSNPESHEVAARLYTFYGPLDLGVAYVYNFDTEAHYFEGSVGTGLELTDSISTELDVKLGFSEEELSHLIARVSFPIAVTETVTLTPWAAGIFRDEDTHPTESGEEFVAGASLGVRF